MFAPVIPVTYTPFSNSFHYILHFLMQMQEPLINFQIHISDCIRHCYITFTTNYSGCQEPRWHVLLTHTLMSHPIQYTTSIPYLFD